MRSGDSAVFAVQSTYMGKFNQFQAAIVARGVYLFLVPANFVPTSGTAQHVGVGAVLYSALSSVFYTPAAKICF